MTDILMFAIFGYFLLNCVITSLSIIQGAYIRNKNGLSLISFPDPEEDPIKEMAKDCFSSLLFFVGAIPIAIYLFALIQADQLKISEKNKKKNKKRPGNVAMIDPKTLAVAFLLSGAAIFSYEAGKAFFSQDWQFMTLFLSIAVVFGCFFVVSAVDLLGGFKKEADSGLPVKGDFPNYTLYDKNRKKGAN